VKGISPARTGNAHFSGLKQGRPAGEEIALIQRRKWLAKRSADVVFAPRMIKQGGSPKRCPSALEGFDDVGGGFGENRRVPTRA
jgi:hypothetical protein